MDKIEWFNPLAHVVREREIQILSIFGWNGIT
jgi:hypothetical protein